MLNRHTSSRLPCVERINLEKAIAPSPIVNSFEYFTCIFPCFQLLTLVTAIILLHSQHSGTVSDQKPSADLCTNCKFCKLACLCFILQLH